MTPATFEMDNYMPDWTDDFDYGAFLNLPPDVDDQGGEDGSAYLLPGLGGNVPGLSCSLPLLGSPENSEAHQSTISQRQPNNASPETSYGAGNIIGDESGASGPASATVFEWTGLDSTIPNIQEPSQSFANGPAKESALPKKCTCMSCLLRERDLRCRLCQKPIPLIYIRDMREHERTHYGQRGSYACLEQDCHTTTKNFGDLKRHYRTKHCTSSAKEQYPCTIPWCKYSGNNGFARKDKLKSHYKNIHEGKPGPVKGCRVIKPATLPSHVSSSSSAAGKGKEREI